MTDKDKEIDEGQPNITQAESVKESKTKQTDNAENKAPVSNDQKEGNTAAQVTSDQMQRIVDLINSGKTVEEVAKTLNLSRRTVHRRLHEIRETQPQAITREATPEEEEADDGEEEESNNTRTENSNNKREVMSDDSKVQNDLFVNFERGAYKELLPILRDEFKARFKAGATLVQYELTYKSHVEDMGLSWDEFIKFSFETGYSLILNQYIENQLKEEREKERLEQLQSDIQIQAVKRITEGE